MNDNKKESACHFYKQYQIEEAVAKYDDLRPIMQNIHFENGYAYASDGHIVVKAKIEDISNLTEEMIDKLNGKNINWRIFKVLRTLEDNQWIDEITEKEIIVRNEKYMFSYTTNYSFSEAAYPHCEHVINKEFDYKVDNIGINFDSLKKLQKAFGSTNTYLVFGYSGECSIVKVDKHTLLSDNKDIQGYIMPLNLNE